MKRVVIITLAVAAPVFLSTRAIFPPPAHGPQPQGLQIALFMGVGAAEALSLGLAVALLVSAPRVIRGLPPSSRRPAGVVTAVAAAWLGNWWIHDNLHMVVGMDIPGLLALEYGFHVTLMAASACAVWALARLARLHAAASSAPLAPTAGR